MIPILPIIVTLIVIGVLLWLAETYIPMDPQIKSILRAIVIICVVLWLLQVFGVFGYMGNVTVHPLATQPLVR